MENSGTANKDLKTDSEELNMASKDRKATSCPRSRRHGNRAKQRIGYDRVRLKRAKTEYHLAGLLCYVHSVKPTLHKF